VALSSNAARRAPARFGPTPLGPTAHPSQANRQVPVVFLRGKRGEYGLEHVRTMGKTMGKANFGGKTTGKLRIYWDKYGENAFFGVFVMFLEVGTLPLAGFFG